MHRESQREEKQARKSERRRKNGTWSLPFLAANWWSPCVSGWNEGRKSGARKSVLRSVVNSFRSPSLSFSRFLILALLYAVYIVHIYFPSSTKLLTELTHTVYNTRFHCKFESKKPSNCIRAHGSVYVIHQQRMSTSQQQKQHLKNFIHFQPCPKFNLPSILFFQKKVSMKLCLIFLHKLKSREKKDVKERTLVEYAYIHICTRKNTFYFSLYFHLLLFF